MSNQEFKIVELESLKMEDGARELMSTPEMQPYLRHIEAVMTQGDVDAALREIAALPLDQRYVWRVASALKWGFADFVCSLLRRGPLRWLDLAHLMS